MINFMRVSLDRSPSFLFMKTKVLVGTIFL
jgi:hypothetical protein